jgi:hypothetical protein
VALALALAACSRSHGAASPRDAGNLRTAGIGSHADPTVRPPRLLPENVDETQGYGTEPGGGIRAITSGLRVVAMPRGAIMVAEDRLPQPPQLTAQLPERLGGGFLFVLGTSVWRSDRWLEPATPIFTSSQPVHGIIAGLDRVYLRAGNAYLAIDGRTGAPLDLGPWPAAPHVTGYAAADGWRAAAIADLRGVVTTFDAGATWRTLELPLEPKHVLVSGDSLAIGGLEQGHTDAWFEVRGDGSVARLGGPPEEAKGKVITTPQGTTPAAARPGFYPGSVTIPQPSTVKPKPAAPPDAEPDPQARDADPQADLATRIFGKRPLAAAIEDGWPLTDGTALVARDGALARVRLADGALLEIAAAAFPLKAARCHPLSLNRPTAVGAFGFVCGEPRGATVLYAYEPLRGRLAEIQRFDGPRVVTSSGNGAIAVRGACTESEDPGSDSKVHPYCVLGHDNVWREVHVRGDVGGERVVVLADGRIVVVSPPSAPGAAARLTILERGQAKTVTVTFPTVAADVERVLRLGVWLDGFEERRPGVVGGWLEAGSAMLGVEIELDGTATVGQFIRDAGLPFVAGRYGLGWTAARRGYETTDGGMTWRPLELPDPIVPLAKVERRACGPVGCIAGGWLRVGWGEMKKPATPVVPPPHRAAAALGIPHAQLACEPMAPHPPAAPQRRTEPRPAPPMSPRRPTFGGPPVLGPAGGYQGMTELPPFFSHPPPPLRDGERGVPFDVQDLPERHTRIGPLAKVYAWGPRTGDWDTLGRWQVKWLSPFAGWPEVRASAPTLPPETVLEATRMGSPFGYGSYYGGYGAGMWSFVAGDDPSHALLVARRMGRPEIALYELEAERAPVEVTRADGEPFVEIDGVVRQAGRWLIATPPIAGAVTPRTTLWQVEGSVARELATVPRAGVESGRATGAKLARRSDGRSVGLIVDGQPTAERNVATRWVLPIDLETGQLGEPEPLGYVDLAGRALEACADDGAGWVLDTTMPGATVRMRLPQGAGSLHSLLGRVRLTRTRACVERVAGMFGTGSPAALVRPGAPRATGSARGGEIMVTALSGQVRHPLRCTVSVAK